MKRLIGIILMTTGVALPVSVSRAAVFICTGNGQTYILNLNEKSAMISNDSVHFEAFFNNAISNDDQLVYIGKTAFAPDPRIKKAKLSVLRKDFLYHPLHMNVTISDELFGTISDTLNCSYYSDDPADPAN